MTSLPAYCINYGIK